VLVAVLIGRSVVLLVVLLGGPALSREALRSCARDASNGSCQWSMVRCTYAASLGNQVEDFKHLFDKDSTRVGSCW
jgi:hypothetical protein